MLLLAKIVMWGLLLSAIINVWQQFDKFRKGVYIRIKGKRNEQIRLMNVFLQIFIVIMIGLALLSLYYI